MVELDLAGLLGVVAWRVSDDSQYLKGRLAVACAVQGMRTDCKAKNKVV